MIVWHCNKCMAPMFTFLPEGRPQDDTQMTARYWEAFDGSPIVSGSTIECPECGYTDVKSGDQFLRLHDDEGIHVIGELV